MRQRWWWAVVIAVLSASVALAAGFPVGPLYVWSDPVGPCPGSGCVSKAKIRDIAQEVAAIEVALGLNMTNVTAHPFKTLTDVPHSYAGQHGKVLALNSSEDSIVFQPSPSGIGLIVVNPTTGEISCPTCGTGSGSVSSVTLTMENVIFNPVVSGSPITTTGNLTPSLKAQTANRVFAGPTSGGNASPTFRALVAADIPALDAAAIATGVLGLGRIPALPESQVTNLVSDLAAAALDSAVLHKTGDEVATGKKTIDSVVTKNSPVFDVRAYGVLCDGSTDDAANLNTALAAAAGGVAYVPAGTCIVGTTLSIPSSTTLRGAGAKLTTLKLKNSVNTDILTNSTTGGGGNSWITIEDIGFDGNKANNSNANAILFNNVTDFTIRRVFTNNTPVSGIRLFNTNRGVIESSEVTGSATTSGNSAVLLGVNVPSNMPASNTQLTHVNVHDNGAGLGSAGANGFLVAYGTGNVFTNCISSNNGSSGFKIGGGTNTILSGNYASFNTHGFQLQGDPANTTLTGNVAYRNTDDGFIVAALTGLSLIGVTLSGNVSVENGQAPVAESYGISVTTQAATALVQDVSIVGNVIIDNQGSPTQARGVSFGSNGGTIDRVVVNNNVIRASVTILEGADLLLTHYTKLGNTGSVAIPSYISNALTVTGALNAGASVLSSLAVTGALSAGASPATIGAFALPNGCGGGNTSIYFRNAANTGNIEVLCVNGSGQTVLAASGPVVLQPSNGTVALTAADASHAAIRSNAGVLEAIKGDASGLDPMNALSYAISGTAAIDSSRNGSFVNLIYSGIFRTTDVHTNTASGTVAHGIEVCDASASGDVTMTLPASPTVGDHYTLVQRNASHLCVLARAGSQTLDGVNSATLSAGVALGKEERCVFMATNDWHCAGAGT